MKLWNHILVPTDFSQGAEQAFLIALTEARHYGAVLHLLHVVAEEAPDTVVPGFDRLESYYAHQERVANQHLARAAAAAREYGVETHTAVLRHADVGARIVAYCRRARIDLAVVSTQGGQGAGREQLGRTARHVLRQAPCAVITTHPSLGQAPGLVKRVLTTVDFSRFTRAVVGVAAHLAREHDGRLWLLHVVEPTVRSVYQDGEWMQVALHHPETRTEVYGRLHHLAERADLPPKSTTTVQEGPPAEAITAYARHHTMHLIIQGAHGQTDIDYRHLGSVAEEVVRSAPCPVLTLKAPHPALDVFLREEEAATSA